MTTRPVLTVHGRPWDGRWRGAPVIHRYRADWPARFVVCRVASGWMRCTACGREFRVWVCDDADWKMLAKAWRRTNLCVTCFRELAAPRGSYPSSSSQSNAPPSAA